MHLRKSSIAKLRLFKSIHSPNLHRLFMYCRSPGQMFQKGFSRTHFCNRIRAQSEDNKQGVIGQF
jgi:hypothetical protein